MFCEKCGKTISGDSVFCEFCGHKISEEEKVIKEQKKESVIIDSTLKQIASHLEFLGYEINKLELGEQGDREYIGATHPKKNNIMFWNIFRDFVMLKVSLTTNKKLSLKMNEFLNDANKKLDFAKVYCDEENGFAVIRFETTYTGKYSKEIFGQFLEIFENDQNRLGSFDNFTKLFID